MPTTQARYHLGRQRFIIGFAERMSALRILLASTAAGGGSVPAAAARQAAHKIAGISEVLGFPVVSQHATRLEHALSATPVDLATASETLAGMAAGFLAGLEAAPPEEASSATPTAAARILIVEDDAVAPPPLASAMTAAGLEVITAPDGRAAMQLARAEHPDVILLDLDRPGFDGLGVCRHLKLDPEMVHIPIVLVTAQDALIETMAGLTTGFDDYLRKPFLPNDLLIRIQRLAAARVPVPRDAAAAQAAGATLLPYEDFAFIARDLIASGPATLLLLRTPPALVETLADHLMAELRRRDICGRYSPAHLILLAPGLAADEARASVERVLSQLGSDRSRVAIGVVETPGGVEAAAGFDALVASADLSLAQARVDRSGGSERQTVLLADEDPDVLEIIDARLQNAGYRTVIAFDGVQALEMVKTDSPDVVLLDLMLAKLTGFEVLAGLRDLGDRRPRTIVVSARDRDGDVARAFELGADDYVSKPFNPDELLARIARLLR